MPYLRNNDADEDDSEKKEGSIGNENPEGGAASDDSGY